MRLVVTANKRLAAAYRHQQRPSAQAVWVSPQVLPLAIWLQQLWQAWVAFSFEQGETPPQLLTPLQSRFLWQQIIESDAQDLAALLHPSLLAQQAQQAWQLCHAWQIDWQDTRFEMSGIESQQFTRWAALFDQRCQQLGVLDSSQLMAFLLPRLPVLRAYLPSQLMRIGFVQETSLESAWWQALADLGVTMEAAPSQPLPNQVRAQVYATPIAEQSAIADWVVDSLQTQPNAKLVVALPDLASWRDSLLETISLKASMQNLLPASLDMPSRITVSLGDPLAQQPVVALWRLVLGLSPQKIEHADLTTLLLSPLLMQADLAVASELVNWLNQQQVAVWRWSQLWGRLLGQREKLASKVALSSTNQRLLEALSHEPLLKRLRLLQPDGKQLGDKLPSAWATWMRQRGQQVGLNGVGLGSVAFQALTSAYGQLGQLASVDALAGSVDLGQALSLLGSVLSSPWQAKSETASVQLLGMLEAVNVDCDGLWLANMTAEQWPPKANPTAFIPLALQRQAGMRDAMPQKQAAYALALMQSVMAQAARVVVSHAQHDVNGSEWRPSGLMAFSWQMSELREDRPVWLASALASNWQDWQAPPTEVGELAAGGTGLFKAQSQCPFTAFARWRLGCQPLREATEGPDKALRGSLLHEVLEAIWQRLQTSQQLCALSDDALCAVVDETLAHVLEAAHQQQPTLLPRAYVQCEQPRMREIALIVLAQDKQLAQSDLGHFTVISESDHVQTVAGVRISMRIDRLQQFDSGASWVVDYKTGLVKTKDWDGLRPKEPQLPLYAVALQQAEVDVAGIAFYEIGKLDKIKLNGLSREDCALPTQKKADDDLAWQTRVTDWRIMAERLATDFAQGVAVADPLPQACTYCQLSALCRRAEWQVPVDEDEERADESVD